MNGYLTRENLTKTANDLEQFLANKNRRIVTLLPLLQRQAKVKTTRYMIQLIYLFIYFLPASLDTGLPRGNVHERDFFLYFIFYIFSFIYKFSFRPSTFPSTRLRACLAYTTRRFLAFNYQVSTPLATQSKVEYWPLYQFVKLRAQKPFSTFSKASSVSCVHIGSWRSSIKYLRPWLLNQKLSIGRLISSSNWGTKAILDIF